MSSTCSRSSLDVNVQDVLPHNSLLKDNQENNPSPLERIAAGLQAKREKVDSKVFAKHIKSGVKDLETKKNLMVANLIKEVLETSNK